MPAQSLYALELLLEFGHVLGDGFNEQCGLGSSTVSGG
jgi:hypothetical protein